MVVVAAAGKPKVPHIAAAAVQRPPEEQLRHSSHQKKHLPVHWHHCCPHGAAGVGGDAGWDACSYQTGSG